MVHHPNNRWSALILRMCAAALIVDRTTWEPVTCLHMPKGSPDNLPVKKVGSAPDVWEVVFEDVKNPAHEAGFSPDGHFFTMMNNLRQNNMPVFDTSDPDPRRWKKVTFVEDPEWVGEYPSPFHLCFSMDRSKMFVSVLSPKPRNSGVVAVDTKTWKIIKKFDDVGPDCQTMSVSYDGKYVFQIFSGFQRLSCGLFVFTQDTLEPVGFFPNFGGHHDCVIVPTKRGALAEQPMHDPLSHSTRCGIDSGETCRELPDGSTSGWRCRTWAGGGCARFCWYWRSRWARARSSAPSRCSAASSGA